MDLSKNGKLIRNLRKSKGMTQKQVAESLGIEPKTVSKWETGRGFPDISYVTELAEIFGVNEKILLSGNLIKNTLEVGNMKKIKFYACPHCGSIMQGMGGFNAECCGSRLAPLNAKKADSGHAVKITETENDYYVEFNHEMTKEHFIIFAAYVTFDRVLTIRLYPEQDSSVRFPKMYGGKFYYCCNKHGLFEYTAERKQKNATETNLTALVSAFARAEHTENAENPVYKDGLAKKLFSKEEYIRMKKYISDSGNDVKTYVNTQLAPIPLARAAFCAETLKTAVKTGTTQYVLLGSGLDTSSLQNKYNIEIFEIDKKNVIEDKCARLKRAGIEISANVHLIPTDLSSGNLEKSLKNNGFNENAKTLFSCLGLLYYLTEKEVSDLFDNISRFAADGSTVVFDFADNHLFSSEIPRVKEMLNMAEQSGTPMKFCCGYDELELLMQKYGFLIYEFLNAKDMQNKYFSKCDTGITAFEHINYAAAVLKKI